MYNFDISHSKTKDEQVYISGDIRLSVITGRILRVEKSEGGVFCDKPSQMAVNRSFSECSFTVKEKAPYLIVKTEVSGFRINRATLRTEALIGGRWVFPSDKTNLGGTARTLDGTFGFLVSWRSGKKVDDKAFIHQIGKGIFAENGAVEIDDSDSFLFDENRCAVLRETKETDKYIFAFGDNFIGGLKEFFALSGGVPVLPKYALGNWWSRYHAYTQDEYLGLMDRFEKNDIPFTVAVIDMDWHIVKNVPKDLPSSPLQIAGWTGYTFEKSLIPDHRELFKNLKSRGMAITLNLHPRDGVRYYEEQYEDMCRAVGQDPEEKQPVEFNLTSPEFRKAYFEILHHPYEKDGVDFWWIDWQQGTSSPLMPGFDPLWLLNHYHMLDICRDGKDGLILSRYSGLGSHRYPVAFSGDTIVCWKSLALQPYFTAIASNAGITRWSHDIGGHILNVGNNEIYIRWLQYGVFSPVCRLHSNNTSISKEPWNYKKAEETAEKFLRLRHRLLPYIYSCDRLTAEEGVPLISPMYYFDRSPLAKAKKYRNQYYFGRHIIVVPVTAKTRKGRINARFYLPEGSWTDIFTGEKYSGGEYEIYCPMDRIPVFAEDGAIIPMLPQRKGNSVSFEEIEVFSFGSEGTFTMWDDKGESVDFTLSNGEMTYKMLPDCITKTITIHREEKIELV